MLLLWAKKLESLGTGERILLVDGCEFWPEEKLE